MRLNANRKIITVSVVVGICLFYLGYVYASDRIHVFDHMTTVTRPEVEVPALLSDVQAHIPDQQVSIDKNYYITQKGYTHRFNNDIYTNVCDPFWQLPIYVFASVTCKRIGCKTIIIDIGCGQATKLAIMPNKVNKIGVDFPAQTKLVAAKYPEIKFLETDLTKDNCALDISPDILKDAVVISADVIEHIPNPFNCYLRLLSNMTQTAKAVIVSSPDRDIFYHF